MERKYIIITDSTTDLPVQILKELGVEYLPLKYTIGGKEYTDYLDQNELNMHEFYDMLRNKGTSKTSQVNSETFKDVYKGFLDKGYDILGICFSSGLSGTYNSARIACEELQEEYKNRKIMVIDSLCACMGEGLIVYYAAKNWKNGMSIEDNYKFVEDTRLHVCHWFTVKDIDFLKRGGRVSGASAFLAKTLNINPVMHVDDAGHLISRFKKIGRNNALKEMVKQMNESFDHSFKQTVFISHGDCIDDANKIKDMILESNSDIERVEIGTIGPVVGSHSGPGTLAIFFIGSHR